MLEQQNYKIPNNLNECMEVLDEFFNATPQEDRDWFKNSLEDEATGGVHHTLGRWIRNNWGLWKKDTELYKVFKNMDIWHADDMSDIILTSYHRKINGKDINIKEQVAYYLEYWKEYEKTNGPIEKE